MAPFNSARFDQAAMTFETARQGTGDVGMRTYAMCRGLKEMDEGIRDNLKALFDAVEALKAEVDAMRVHLSPAIQAPARIVGR